MKPESAKSIIKRMGGPSVVARICCVHRTTASRWKSGKSPMPAVARRLIEEIDRGCGHGMILYTDTSNPKITWPAPEVPDV